MSTHRQRLRELSFDTHGVITLAGAREVGVPAVEVRKLAHRGALRRLGSGVYRMLEAPFTPLDEFAEAVALAGADAVLVDESVLAALDLALVNLRVITVASPHRVRVKLPPTVKVVRRHIPPEDRDHIDGIPAMTVEAALVGARLTVVPERLVDAAHDAVRLRLLAPDRLSSVVAALGGSCSVR